MSCARPSSRFPSPRVRVCARACWTDRRGGFRGPVPTVALCTCSCAFACTFVVVADVSSIYARHAPSIVVLLCVDGCARSPANLSPLAFRRVPWEWRATNTHVGGFFCLFICDASHAFAFYVLPCGGGG